MTKFKEGDHVRMRMNGVYWYGVITIVISLDSCKVMFDDGDGPDYWYYSANELELINPEDIKEEQ